MTVYNEVTLKLKQCYYNINVFHILFERVNIKLTLFQL